MAVTQAWSDVTASPPDLVTGQTLTQTAWEIVLSCLDYLGGTTGKNGQHGGLIFFRNAADSGKEFQRVTATGTTATATTAGANIWYNQQTPTWPVAFSGTPTAVAVATSTDGTTFNSCGTRAMSTTGCTVRMWSDFNTGAPIVEIWALGAP